MDITLPSSFDAASSFSFSDRFEEICKCKDLITFNFPYSVNAQPAGLLLMGSTLRRIRDNNEVTFTNIIEGSYLGNMGFYQSINEDKGKSIDQLKGNNRFIPIIRQDILEMNKREFYENNGSGDPYDIVIRISKRITEVLLNADKSLYDVSYYSLFEVIRNVLEHSKKSVVWYSGQYWPTKKKVEIAIMDEGCGILESFKRSHKHDYLSTDYDAIQEAVKEGTTSSLKKQSDYGEHDNTGYGLYKIKKLCELAGELSICSGKSAVIFNNRGETSHSTNHQGTMISIVLYYDKIREHSVEISEILHPRRR